MHLAWRESRECGRALLTDWLCRNDRETRGVKAHEGFTIGPIDDETTRDCDVDPRDGQAPAIFDSHTNGRRCAGRDTAMRLGSSTNSTAWPSPSRHMLKVVGIKGTATAV
jgi:hypothetical protein